MHFAVLHEHGRASELRWALEHASPSYQVLNACRAWRFAEEDVLCSKSEGAEWASRRGGGEDALTDAALGHRRGGGDEQPDVRGARLFLLSVLERL